MQLGLIGLGHMGHGMAARLLAAGHDVIVYNRTPEKARDLVDQGATLADSVADACRADAVITMVADDAAIESIAFDDAGIVRHLPRGGIHISSSTIGTTMARRLSAAHAAVGQYFVAAPVLGRPEAAAAGKLFVFAAGPREALDTVDPVFDAIGQRTFIVSDRPEQAILVKLSCNFLTASVIEAVGEAMALVGKAGIDPEQYLDILTSTLFDAPVYKTYGKLIAQRSFEPPQFSAPLGEKDIRLALTAAEDLRVPMPLASLVRDRFLTLLARGGERLDWSAIGGLPAHDAGITEQ